MNEQQMMEEINRLARLCEAKGAELAKLMREKENEMRKSFSLENELSEAQAQIAMQAEKIELISAELDVCGIESAKKLCMELNSATSETVAAWRAKETEPLHMEVFMLRELLCVLRAWSYTAGNVEDEYRSHKLFPTNYRPSTQKPLWSAIIHAIDDTKVTALAYEREVENRGALKALESARHTMYNLHCLFTDTQAICICVIDNTIAELRAVSKGEVK